MVLSITTMEFSTTQRGAQLLIYNGYMYIINRKAQDGRIFWRCQKSRQCNGGITTLGDQIVSQRNTHNHSFNPAEIRVQKIKANLNKKAQETVQPIPAIYSQEVSSVVI